MNKSTAYALVPALIATGLALATGSAAVAGNGKGKLTCNGAVSHKKSQQATVGARVTTLAGDAFICTSAPGPAPVPPTCGTTVVHGPHCKITIDCTGTITAVSPKCSTTTGPSDPISNAQFAAH